VKSRVNDFLSWCLLNLLLVGLLELELEHDHGVALPDLMHAWMEGTTRHSRGGLGARGGCPLER
jgi:hypothetical protein